MFAPKEKAKGSACVCSSLARGAQPSLSVYLVGSRFGLTKPDPLHHLPHTDREGKEKGEENVCPCWCECHN